MRYFFTVLLAFFLIPIASLHAQEEKTPSIETIEQLTDSIQSMMKKPKIPGLLLTIVTRDTVLYMDGLGISNVEEERPVDAYQAISDGVNFQKFCLSLYSEVGGRREIISW